MNSTRACMHRMYFDFSPLFILVRSTIIGDKNTLIPKFLKTLGTISLSSNILDNIYFQNKQIDG